MRHARRIALALLCLLCVAVAAAAQVDLPLLQQSSRVAMLPFTNLAESPDGAVKLMTAARRELVRRGVDLADSATVAEALRRHRIRNTGELSLEDVRALASEASVRYLLTGTIDRYSEADSTVEVALSARLLDAATMEVVWANSAVEHADPRTHLLGVGTHHAAAVTPAAMRALFEGFRYRVPPQAKTVQAIRMKHQRPRERAGHTVMVVTFGNETETHFAGNIVAGQLLTELSQRGFGLVDPGRVREAMLNSRDLMQGEINRALLDTCNRALGADFVLTGTVSRFETRRGQLFEEPAVAFEARLIDAKRGDVVWAKDYSREGKDSAWIFNLGYVHGLTALSRGLCHAMVKDLPVRRARGTATPPSLAEERRP